MDRIDIHMEVPAVEFKDLSSDKKGKSSSEMMEIVQKAREIQLNRFKRTKINTNAQMNSRQIRKFCRFVPTRVLRKS